MKIFNEILLKHTDIQTCRESYVVNKDIGITVDQKENKVVMWAFNYTTDRSVNLGTKRFEKLIDGFKSVASYMYVKDNYYHIILETTDKDVDDDKSNELEVDELKKRVECLNDIIARLEARNEKLENDVKKYREDYLYYHFEWSKLRDKDFKRTLENIDGVNKSLNHNARGAGRRAKFSDAQVDEIKSLREDGSTIKEIATRFECSVGLIHKLINEKQSQ
ncbi:MAG: helix-turn-helix domain-containing protein [Filifactoraceae bacterium]